MGHWFTLCLSDGKQTHLFEREPRCLELIAYFVLRWTTQGGLNPLIPPKIGENETKICLARALNAFDHIVVDYSFFLELPLLFTGVLSLHRKCSASRMTRWGRQDHPVFLRFAQPFDRFDIDRKIHCCMFCWFRISIYCFLIVPLVLHFRCFNGQETNWCWRCQFIRWCSRCCNGFYEWPRQRFEKFVRE